MIGEKIEKSLFTLWIKLLLVYLQPGSKGENGESHVPQCVLLYSLDQWHNSIKRGYCRYNNLAFKYSSSLNLHLLTGKIFPGFSASPLSPYLLTLAKTWKDRKVYNMHVRSKYMGRPEGLDSLNIHEVGGLVKGEVMREYVITCWHMQTVLDYKSS